MDYNMVDASEILEDQERKTRRNIDAVIRFLYSDSVIYLVRHDKKAHGKNDGGHHDKLN